MKCPIRQAHIPSLWSPNWPKPFPRTKPWYTNESDEGMYDTCGEKHKTVSVKNFQNVKNEPQKGNMCHSCERLLMFDIYFPHHSSLRHKACTYANTNRQAHIKRAFSFILYLLCSFSLLHEHTHKSHTLMAHTFNYTLPGACPVCIGGGRDVWPWLPSNDLTDVLIKRKTLSVLSYPQERRGVCVCGWGFQ